MNMKILLGLLLSLAIVPRVEAAPEMAKIPVGNSYLDYSAADDTATLDGEKFEAEREKLGLTMTIMTNGEQRAQEIERGYVTMFATWAQTTLRVPLGWFAFEAKDNTDESLVLLPDKTVRIVARAAVSSESWQKERDAFDKLKKNAVEQTRQRLQAQKLTPVKLELMDISEQEFVVRADDVKDAQGKNWSYLERFSQRSTPQERAQWWAKYDRGEALGSLAQPLAMSLLASKTEFEKYLGLFGLMVRDEGLNWVKEELLTPEEFAARVPDAERFVKLADDAVALFKAGDVQALQARFPTAFEGTPLDGLEPYFQDAAAVLKLLPPKPTRTAITLATDRDPENPLFRVTFVRYFEMENIFPSYAVAMEKDSKSGELSLLGVGTGTLAELEEAKKMAREEANGAEN